MFFSLTLSFQPYREETQTNISYLLVMSVLEADVLPHDEEDGGGDEGELDGAGEEEGGAVLQHLPHQGTAAP